MDNPRYHFLVNILCFHKSLLPESLTEVSEEAEEGVGQEHSKYDMGDEPLIGPAASLLTRNTPELNRLRLYWSFQMHYFEDEDFFENIIEELNHITFEAPPAHQQEVTREIKAIFAGYTQGPFENMLIQLFFQFSTFQEFMKGVGLCVVTLSKLRAMTRLLPEGKSNELHPIFQMMEFNLPRKNQEGIILSLLQMLSHENHSRIQFENLKRSYNYWLKDYTQPLNIQYHSPITRLLNTNDAPLTLIYRRSPQAPAYAQFVLPLKRNKEPDAPKYFSQADNIKAILKKNYQPVLENFVTTYELTANKDLTRKLRSEIKKADTTLSFKNPNEAALYKIKAAHDVFFNHSLPEPLSPKNMEPHKESYDASIAISLDHIAPYEHINQFKAFTRFNVGLALSNVPIEKKDPQVAKI